MRNIEIRDDHISDSKMAPVVVLLSNFEAIRSNRANSRVAVALSLSLELVGWATAGADRVFNEPRHRIVIIIHDNEFLEVLSLENPLI